MRGLVIKSISCWDKATYDMEMMPQSFSICFVCSWNTRLLAMKMKAWLRYIGMCL